MTIAVDARSCTITVDSGNETDFKKALAELSQKIDAAAAQPLVNLEMFFGQIGSPEMEGYLNFNRDLTPEEQEKVETLANLYFPNLFAVV